MSVDLDAWLPNPSLRITHRRSAAVDAQALWEAAQCVRLADTRVLGRLVRMRIPGTAADLSYSELFHAPPFAVLIEDEGSLVTGLVGRIWTIRRDFPTVAGPDEFRRYSEPGTARVVFANWVQDGAGVRPSAALCSETRVVVADREARVGLAAVRPLVTAFHSLIASEALSAAVRRAERRIG